MGQKIFKCRNCGRYTLEAVCPKCGSDTFRPQPARFSPLDPYGKYRRIARREGNL
ncbi:RNA-protein complex protein Nop10 [Methanolobus sediminis]|uniref:Ribosome biogenesis protein Nop10 n=2 Tax=Methanolobus TaxID=2220 RepID=A0AA51UMS1_9EURY|nr:MULTISPECIES: RNA-protein complex protein Nop10 [Methanolobus]TQD25122.1 RNA-protein complex protein Nop10 [Methanolobus vulcani]WMW25908.1 RNA-protein complex protein Nop10 [Methanolobus sediminis]